MIISPIEFRHIFGILYAVFISLLLWKLEGIYLWRIGVSFLNMTSENEIWPQGKGNGATRINFIGFFVIFPLLKYMTIFLF